MTIWSAVPLQNNVVISTKEQNEARQIHAFEDMGIEKENIYLDKQSGKSADRPKLKEILAFICRNGRLYLLIMVT